MQLLDSVFDRTDLIRSGHVAGHPDDKNVADADIKQLFHRDARIGAGQNRGEWMLPGRGLFQTSRFQIRKLALSGDKPQVPFLENGNGFTAAHRAVAGSQNSRRDH